MATVNSRRAFLAGLLAAAIVTPGGANSRSRFIVGSCSSKAKPEEVDGFMYGLETEYKRLVSFLGEHNLTEPEKKIVVNIGGDFCREEAGYENGQPHITLCLKNIRANTTGRAHELMHAATHSESGVFRDFLKEGMATYFQRNYGLNHAYPDFGRPFRSVAFETAERAYGHADLPSIKEAAGIIRGDSVVLPNHPTFEDKMRMAYSMAGSFMTYLAEEKMKGNIDGVMELYYGCRKTDDWERICGVQFEREEDAWRRYIQDKPR